jgi:hypothetical protein
MSKVPLLQLPTTWPISTRTLNCRVDGNCSNSNFFKHQFSSICVPPPLTIAGKAYIGMSNVLSCIRLALVATGQAQDLNRRPKYLCYSCQPLGHSVHVYLRTDVQKKLLLLQLPTTWPISTCVLID